MKQKVLVLAAIMITAFCVPPSHALVIDLKTPIDEYQNLVHIRFGAMYFLIREGFEIFEVAEDYAVWMKDFHRREGEGSTEISFRIKISEASAFQEKPSLAESLVSFRYSAIEMEEMDPEDSFARYMRKKVENLTSTLFYEAREGGRRAMESIKSMLKTLRGTSKN